MISWLKSLFKKDEPQGLVEDPDVPGQARIAPEGVRGRVYAYLDGSMDENPAQQQVASEPSATLTMVVTRADGTVEPPITIHDVKVTTIEATPPVEEPRSVTYNM